MSSTPSFASTPKLGVVQIVNADASALKTLFSAGASGSKLLAVIANSDDTSARVVQVYVTRSGTDYLIGAGSVTTLAGTDGSTNTVNLLGLCVGLPVDNDGQRFLYLESGDVVKVKSTTTVTAAKTVHVSAVAADL